jgi:hypothetical protein
MIKSVSRVNTRNGVCTDVKNYFVFDAKKTDRCDSFNQRESSCSFMENRSVRTPSVTKCFTFVTSERVSGSYGPVKLVEFSYVGYFIVDRENFTVKIKRK